MPSGVPELYTAEDRDRVREALIARGRNDERITGVAVTGSAAAGREDRWSDIDLAFGVRDGVDIKTIIEEWTAPMYGIHGAVDHVDVLAGNWTYRVFLLRNGLQVDVAFAPAAEFGARAPTFKLLFGAVGQPRMPSKPAAAELIGLAWLYSLHVRSSLARGKLWQAEYMLSTARDQVLGLACLRYGLPLTEGRGMDQLPGAVKERLRDAFVGRLDPAELARAFGVIIEALVVEIEATDAELAKRLEPVLQALARAVSQASLGKPLGEASESVS
jgi:hypothetical protein